MQYLVRCGCAWNAAMDECGKCECVFRKGKTFCSFKRDKNHDWKESGDMSRPDFAGFARRFPFPLQLRRLRPETNRKKPGQLWHLLGTGGDIGAGKRAAARAADCFLSGSSGAEQCVYRAGK